MAAVIFCVAFTVLCVWLGLNAPLPPTDMGSHKPNMGCKLGRKQP
jgi:hypothetical protein